MTDKDEAIIDLIEHDRYVLILLTDIDNKTQKLKVHTHNRDDASELIKEAYRLIENDADNKIPELSRF